MLSRYFRAAFDSVAVAAVLYRTSVAAPAPPAASGCGCGAAAGVPWVRDAGPNAAERLPDRDSKVLPWDDFPVPLLNLFSITL